MTEAAKPAPEAAETEEPLAEIDISSLPYAQQLSLVSKLIQNMFNHDPIGTLVGQAFHFCSARSPFVPGQSERVCRIYDAILDALPHGAAALDPKMAEQLTELTRLITMCRDGTREITDEVRKNDWGGEWGSA